MQWSRKTLPSMQTARRSNLAHVRPAEKRLEALCPTALTNRRSTRHCSTYARIGHVGRYRVQRARVPARRHPGGDRGQRVLVQRVGGRRPLEARQRDSRLSELTKQIADADGSSTCRPPSVTWLVRHSLARAIAVPTST